MLSPGLEGDYEVYVPRKGYRWWSCNDLKVDVIERERDSPWIALGESGLGFLPRESIAGGWILRENVDDDEGWFDRKKVVPGEHATLYREFAGLEPDDREAIIGFANRFGLLGITRAVFCDRGGPARRLYGASLNEKCKYVCDRDGDRTKRSVRIWAETLADWGSEIAQLNFACTFFDLLQRADRKSVQKYLKWQKTPFEDDGLPQEAWHFDHLRGKPPDSAEEGVSHEIIFTGFTPSRYDDPLAVGWTWLARHVSKRLRGAVHPALVVSKDGSRVLERLESDTLLAVMWSQLYMAIAGGKSYRQCQYCDKPIEITGKQDGRTRRAMYCKDSHCRIYAFREKEKNLRAQAIELHQAGHKPGAIAKKLGQEVETIKTWIANLTQKRS